MPSDRSGLRVNVIVEDPRTRTFIYALLKHLGFPRKRIRIKAAPDGKGAAERWVIRHYPGEVKALRARRNQRGLRLLAIRDGDKDGLKKRKADFDAALEKTKMEKRGEDERIALLVPTWSIETWLLALLGEDGISEASSLKQRFGHRRSKEKADLRAAARAWSTHLGAHLPSLKDGRNELKRIDP